jgi:hypothetical protein
MSYTASLQPFVDVEIAAARAMQDGCLKKNTWERMNIDEWVIREFSECPEMGNVFRAQGLGCREFERACWGL